MIKALFAADDRNWEQFQAPLAAAFEAAGLAVELSRDVPAPIVDYIIYAPSSSVQDFTPFTRCKAVLNLWAGVETAVNNPTLKLPFCRMVEPGMSEGMREWVVGHVMRLHLGMDAHLNNPTRAWAEAFPPLARSRKVCILGLGELGTACAQALAALGFQVSGYSRSQKEIDGITCYSGDALDQALSGADFVVLLMPYTVATENFLNAHTLSLLAPDACVLNPGRGPLVDDAALLDALDSGALRHATLDVFRIDPLPQDPPFWAHPKITVTPHIASTTRASTASTVIAENIRRGEAGEPFLHLVNRDAGY